VFLCRLGVRAGCAGGAGAAQSAQTTGFSFLAVRKNKKCVYDNLAFRPYFALVNLVIIIRGSEQVA
jgi:hypothetical protein